VPWTKGVAAAVKDKEHLLRVWINAKCVSCLGP